MSKPKVARTNDSYYIGNVRQQITNLKAQYMQLYWQNPLNFNEDAYQKAIRSLCGRIANHFGLKFNKSAEDMKLEINTLISNIPVVDGYSQLVETEEISLVSRQEIVQDEPATEAIGEDNDTIQD